MRRVLIVEDEHHLADGLRFNLEAEDYQVHVVDTGEAALELLLAPSPPFDVVMLDVMLPGIDGFTVIGELRQKGQFIPTLMLTARNHPDDVLRGFTAGADDYLTKPFSYVVLLAHIRALARRSTFASLQEPTVLAAGDLSLDYHERRCARGSSKITLSRREFDLLGVLLARKGDAISKQELIDRVWGPQFNGDPNIVEVYISYLRKKIDLPFGRRSLETVRGFGYRLVADDQHN